MPSLLIVPDVHGKTEVLTKARRYFDQVDHVVQLGDIVDCEDPNCSDETIWQVFCDWHELKRREPQKFILLWGNHELAYLHPDKYRVPKHRNLLEQRINNFLLTRDDLQVAWEYHFGQDKWLFTHAGVTKQFCVQHYLNFNDTGVSVVAQLEHLFTEDTDIFWDDGRPE